MSESVAAIRAAPPTLLLLAEAGSFAFNIATADSDHDFTGVFVIPLRRYLSCSGHGRDTVVKSAPDSTCHDIGKFCKLALQGNPTVLETLYAEPCYINTWGERLREMRSAFLHRRSLAPYFGYYTSQVRRLEKGRSVHSKGGKWNPKFGAHLLRLMYAARHLAETCSVLVKLEGEAQEMVMEARSGRMDVEEVLAQGDRLLAQARLAEAETELPRLPRRAEIDALVYDIRLAYREDD